MDDYYIYFFQLQQQKVAGKMSSCKKHHAAHTPSWHLTIVSDVCCLHISAVPAERIRTGWLCRCDWRGGGITAILCGIWCVVMLITASHHFRLSKFITAWYIPHTYPFLHTPPHISIYLASVSPSVLFTLGEDATWGGGVVGVISDCSIPPVLSVTICHFIHFTLAPSIHPSLPFCIYLPRITCDMRKRCWFDADCNFPLFLSVIIYHFIRVTPSTLTLSVSPMLI